MQQPHNLSYTYPKHPRTLGTTASVLLQSWVVHSLEHFSYSYATETVPDWTVVRTYTSAV
jgi:hypothetical protein